MRFRSLDALRGVAALMVALFHLSLRFGHGVPFLGALVVNGYLFVDFFFVLSGFIVSFAYLRRLETVPGEPFRFLIRRFGRVWPLHVVMLAVFIGWMSSGGWPSLALWTPDGLNPVLSNLLLLQGLGFNNHTTFNEPSWSISTEFWTYVVFMLLAWGLPRLMSFAAAALVLLGAAVVLAFSPQGMAATYDFGLFRCLEGFFTGYIVHLAVGAWRDRLPRGTIAELAAVVGAVAFVALCGAIGNRVGILAPLVFAVGVAVFALERGWVSRLLRTAPFAHLGTISYSIYMVHLIVVHLYALWVPLILTRATGLTWDIAILRDEQPWPATPQIVALILLYVAAVVGVANLTHPFIEQPGRRLFNRLAGAGDTIGAP